MKPSFKDKVVIKKAHAAIWRHSIKYLPYLGKPCIGPKWWPIQLNNPLIGFSFWRKPTYL